MLVRSEPRLNLPRRPTPVATNVEDDIGNVLVQHQKKKTNGNSVCHFFPGNKTNFKFWKNGD